MFFFASFLTNVNVFSFNIAMHWIRSIWISQRTVCFCSFDFFFFYFLKEFLDTKEWWWICTHTCALDILLPITIFWCRASKLRWMKVCAQCINEMLEFKCRFTIHSEWNDLEMFLISYIIFKLFSTHQMRTPNAKAQSDDLLFVHQQFDSIFVNHFVYGFEERCRECRGIKLILFKI